MEPLPSHVWTDAVDPKDYERLRFDGTSQIGHWQPVVVRQHLYDEETGEPLRPSDFPSFPFSLLVLNERAKQAVGDALNDYGELLPLGHGEPLWVYNPLHRVDALDPDKTDYFGPDGMVSTPAFRPEAVHGLHVIALADLSLSPIFVDETIVRSAKAAGLRGMAFPLVWTDEPQVAVRPLNKRVGIERVTTPWPDLPDP